MQLQQQRPEDSPAPNLRLSPPGLRPEAILDAIRPALMATIPVFFLKLWLLAHPSAVLVALLSALPITLACHFGGRHRDRRLAAIAGAAFVLIASNEPALIMLPILAGLAVAASMLRHRDVRR